MWLRYFILIDLLVLTRKDQIKNVILMSEYRTMIYSYPIVDQ